MYTLKCSKISPPPQPPLSGVDTIDGYSVILSPPHLPPTLILHQTTPTTYTTVLTNLTSFTEYTVTVATYNEGGLGPLSLWGVIKTVESPPTAPQEVTVITVLDRNILVTWLPPAMPNGIISSYTIQVLCCGTNDIIAGGTYIRIVVVSFGIL